MRHRTGTPLLFTAGDRAGVNPRAVQSAVRRHASPDRRGAGPQAGTGEEAGSHGASREAACAPAGAVRRVCRQARCFRCGADRNTCRAECGISPPWSQSPWRSERPGAATVYRARDGVVGASTGLLFDRLERIPIHPMRPAEKGSVRDVLIQLYRQTLLRTEQAQPLRDGGIDRRIAGGADG